jgi:hypothetical protein
MKPYLTIAFICLALIGNAQDGGVERSVFGIQTGFLGAWINHEGRLTSSFALRSEFGFDCGIGSGGLFGKTRFLAAPVFAIEPRLYYNLNRRALKHRKTEKNTGNFLTPRISYHPDWFVISNYDNNGVISRMSIIPSWGIRRHIGEHINYEAGMGVGYSRVFRESAGFSRNTGELAFNVLLRIGWTL